MNGKVKAKKLWEELFSPPCPNCSSTRTKEELRDIPVMATASELIEKFKRQMEGKPNKPTRTWKCLDCDSIFDEKGRAIIFKK